MPAVPEASRPPLRLVDSESEPAAWFCGHCGQRHEQPKHRVCPSCGLGLLLQTTASAAPAAHEPFLIVDASLTVQALSARAEHELGIREEHAVNRHITELLIAGEAEPPAAASLPAAIARAASGGGKTERTTVRPSHTFGVRLMARIVSCGPPTAALIVLGQPAVVS